MRDNEMQSGDKRRISLLLAPWVTASKRFGEGELHTRFHPPPPQTLLLRITIGTTRIWDTDTISLLTFGISLIPR